jgi:CubicO group peptidase (beta-lactamase class C family)
MNIDILQNHIWCAALLLLAASSSAVENAFTASETDGVKTFVHAAFDGKKDCMVVGLVDERGTNVLGAGSLENGTKQEVDGVSVFLIGSVTKTFTALLLQNMADRGEVKLDDPVAKYLPPSVKVPARDGHEITLLHLATHTAGFPHDPDTMRGNDWKKNFETCTVAEMYAYLSGFKLTRNPGTEFEYSNFGMVLLGHALALRAGTNFESLLVNRICQPLHMESTRLVPTTDMRDRLAIGHDPSGNPSPPWKLDVYGPAGGIHSTANDLLKYVAAQAGLTHSSLSASMEKTHVLRIKDTHGSPGQSDTNFFGNIAMPWMDRGLTPQPGMELLGHAGGAGSYHAWAGFDTLQHRGVVVLTTSDRYTVEQVGQAVLRRLPLRENVVELTKEPVGIGAVLALDKETHLLLLKKILPNTPASSAGLSDGLLVCAIDNVPTTNRTVNECANLLRGKAGTTVRMELLDPEHHTTNTVELTRRKFVIAQQ